MSLQTLAGLNLPAELSDEIITESARSSAVQTATTKTDLSLTGKNFITVGRRANAFVSEGGRKPETSAAIGSFELTPHKVASVLAVTMEFELTAKKVLDAILAQAPSDFNSTFDSAATGTNGAVAPSVNWADLGTLTANPIANIADFAQVLVSLGRDGGTASHVILTTNLLNELAATYIPDSNGNMNAVFPSLLTATPTLHGIPVLTFEADESVGFVGDFKGKARWGVALDPFVRFDRSGLIVDSNGVEHNLAQENKLGVFVEGFYGFNVVDKKYFRKITAAPAVAPSA